MIRSALEWLMSRSCQRATFSSAATAFPRTTRARPLSRSAVIGLRLCGMAELPFWPGAEVFFHFQHLGPLQMAQLRRPAIDARGDQRQGRGKFRVPIALDDLGRKHRRLEPELLADALLDPRIEMRVGADGAAQFPDADPLGGLREPLGGAAEFVVHQRELQPERDRLRVNAVAAADHRRHFVTPRLRRDHLAQAERCRRREFSRASVNCTARVVSSRSEEVSP